MPDAGTPVTDWAPAFKERELEVLVRISCNIVPPETCPLGEFSLIGGVGIP